MILKTLKLPYTIYEKENFVAIAIASIILMFYLMVVLMFLLLSLNTIDKVFKESFQNETFVFKNKYVVQELVRKTVINNISSERVTPKERMLCLSLNDQSSCIQTTKEIYENAEVNQKYIVNYSKGYLSNQINIESYKLIKEDAK